MSRKDNIQTKLGVLNPHFLKVIDQSQEHAGHSGNPDGSLESHFSIEIAAKELENLPLVKQHRIINELVKEEFDQGLHALSIKIRKD